jgi:hypothetical protein
MCKVVHNPKKTHEDAVIQLCQYLKGTLDKGVVLCPSSKLKVDMFVDFGGLWMILPV